jgi:hypothetical protein
VPDVVIVGAGAAGLATAIFTRRLAPHLSVTVLDGAARPGAKILVSGGSRCNVTNQTVTERDFYGGKRTVVRRVLRALTVEDTIAFFGEIGVQLHGEEHGKLFPDSNRARDVLDALLGELRARGAELRAGTRATGISTAARGFSVETTAGPIDAERVVLATGGQSLPKSGSDGLGYQLARALGHTIVPTTPALVPLTLAGALHAAVSGVSHDVELSVWIDGSIAERVNGSLLWTHFGVSGPAVLDASRIWLRARLEGRETRITVNVVPGSTFETLSARWTALAAERPRASVATVLSTMLPASVAVGLLGAMGLDGGALLAHFPREDRRRLVHGLTEWPLDVTGSRGYTYAEVTAGGVSLDEIDPGTMRSRKCAGLYLVGEILDVDGRIGGFNFQWAWSSAMAAARGLCADRA